MKFTFLCRPEEATASIKYNISLSLYSSGQSIFHHSYSLFDHHFNNQLL